MKDRDNYSYKCYFGSKKCYSCKYNCTKKLDKSYETYCGKGVTPKGDGKFIKWIKKLLRRC